MFEKLRDIIEAQTNDLKRLARIAGCNPRWFYRGADLKNVDLTGQDLRGVDFSGADFSDAVIDERTTFDPDFEQLLRPIPPSSVNRPTVFISYSHKDEIIKDLVVSHLQVAERNGEFLVWSDRKIAGGDDWRKEIDQALGAADLVVLLISPYFLTSNFIMDHEINALVERKEREGLRFYPILARSCNWRAVPWLEDINIRPIDGRALLSLRGNARESVVAGMAAEIGQLLQEDRERLGEIADLRSEAETMGVKLGITEDAVQSFLQILNQRHVSSEDLKYKLEEIAQQYVHMQAQLASLDKDDPVNKALIEKAATASAEGDYDEAEDLRTQAELRDLSAARQAAAQADQRFLNAAATRALRGEASLVRLRYVDAAEHFDEAAKLVPPSAPGIRAAYTKQRGSALIKAGRTLAAIEAYRQAIELHPDDPESWIDFGRLQLLAGDLSSAEATFTKALAAADHNGNDLYLSDIYRELGEARKRLGNFSGAIEAYEAALVISQRIAKDDLDGADSKRALMIANANLGKMTSSANETTKAREYLKSALSIANSLEHTDRLSPSDAEMIEDLGARLEALDAHMTNTDG